MLFDIPHEELTDAEIAAVLRESLTGGGRVPRDVELYLASIGAEHLVDGLRMAGLLVIRPMPRRLTGG